MTCETLSRWRLVLEARDALLGVIAPALPLVRFMRRATAMAREMSVSRPNRPMQLSIAREIFTRSLG